MSAKKKERWIVPSNEHIQKNEYMEKLYTVAAQIVLKYGRMGAREYGYCAKGFTEERIREFWEKTRNYPSDRSFKSLTIKNIRWYLYNKTTTTDPIWTADFVYGLAQATLIKNCKNSYPTLTWFWNTSLANIFREMPYGGRLYEGYPNYKLSGVPALWLKHGKDSISFMAGVLATGEAKTIDGVDYIAYSKKVEKYINQWNIPVEFIKPHKIFISPVFPALFTNHMPTACSFFRNSKNPCGGYEYPIILWRTYVNNKFMSDAIPYLKARRTIFYRHKEMDNVMAQFDEIRLRKGFLTLDSRIGNVVREWATFHLQKDNAQV
jgi:hypothetical protein